MGEQKVNRKLTALSRRNDNCQSFYDLTLKTPDGSTQVDHILLSPHGIFVIETKNLKGWIFGDENQKQWTQVLYKKKFKFQNPIHQNYKHVKAVQRLLGADSRELFNIVVFVGRCTFKTAMPQNVVKRRSLVPLINSYSDNILSSQKIEMYSTLLNKAVTHSSITQKEHIRNVNQNKNNPVCPRCGKPMVLRTARKGSNAGSEFWGCSGFPTCRATKSLK